MKWTQVELKSMELLSVLGWDLVFSASTRAWSLSTCSDALQVSHLLRTHLLTVALFEKS